MFSVYFHQDLGGQEKERKEKRKKTYQQVSKPCLYCKIPSAKPISFQEKKNYLILFLNSNNSVPVAAVTLLNF